MLSQERAVEKPVEYKNSRANEIAAREAAAEAERAAKKAAKKQRKEDRAQAIAGTDARIKQQERQNGLLWVDGVATCFAFVLGVVASIGGVVNNRDLIEVFNWANVKAEFNGITFQAAANFAILCVHVSDSTEDSRNNQLVSACTKWQAFEDEGYVVCDGPIPLPPAPPSPPPLRPISDPAGCDAVCASTPCGDLGCTPNPYSVSLSDCTQGRHDQCWVWCIESGCGGCDASNTCNPSAVDYPSSGVPRAPPPPFPPLKAPTPPPPTPPPPPNYRDGYEDPICASKRLQGLNTSLWNIGIALLTVKFILARFVTPKPKHVKYRAILDVVLATLSVAVLSTVVYLYGSSCVNGEALKSWVEHIWAETFPDNPEVVAALAQELDPNMGVTMMCGIAAPVCAGISLGASFILAYMGSVSAGNQRASVQI